MFIQWRFAACLILGIGILFILLKHHRRVAKHYSKVVLGKFIPETKGNTARGASRKGSHKSLPYIKLTQLSQSFRQGGFQPYVNLLNEVKW